MPEETVLGKGIEKVKELIAPKPDTEGESSIKLKFPNHLALTMEGIFRHSQEKKLDLAETYKKSFIILKNLVTIQVKHNITILTVLAVPSSTRKDTENFSVLLDSLINFLNDLKKDPTIHKNKVKVSVLGKWYDLPGRLITPIKELMDETRDYDAFFMNICINYSGQEEITDALKIIARQVKADKIDPDLITKEIVKENLYSSYFIPPDLILKTGLKHTIPNLLLLDSFYSKIFFS